MSNDKMTQKDSNLYKELLSMIFTLLGFAGVAVSVWKIWGFWVVLLLVSSLVLAAGILLGVSKTGKE